MFVSRFEWVSWNPPHPDNDICAILIEARFTHPARLENQDFLTRMSKNPNPFVSYELWVTWAMSFVSYEQYVTWATWAIWAMRSASCIVPRKLSNQGDFSRKVGKLWGETCELWVAWAMRGEAGVFCMLRQTGAGANWLVVASSVWRGGGICHYNVPPFPNLVYFGMEIC